MTRFAVLSDVHANMYALKAVLKALEDQKVDAVLVAGDLVGYGSRPNECISLLRQHPAIFVVAGNHDRVATLQAPLDKCESSLARETLRWTMRHLSQENVSYLAALPTTTRLGPLVLTHGSLRDEFEYVRTPEQATTQLAMLADHDPDAQLLIHGHTHVPWAVGERDGICWRGRPGSFSLEPCQRYLLNPGSVGQSRQRSPKARYILLDLSPLRVTSVAVAYDLAACRADLRRQGLPGSACHRPPPLLARPRQLARHLLRGRGQAS